MKATESLRKLQMVQSWRKNLNRAWYSLFDIGSLMFDLFWQCSLLFFIYFIVEFFFGLAKHFSIFSVIVLIIILSDYGVSVGVMGEPINMHTNYIMFLKIGNCSSSNGDN
ncbi:MAG: hypothetical protein EZS28_010132 [Streblomastix strix]|uniref:Uncharacterized protein n=1 Tax=Streblomastix strix TaxID=222440 RepID=A0A5J4WH94_9EUKA|nr:MAG: hypothetical protein EZS28_010132 [Streblomastix strix]